MKKITLPKIVDAIQSERPRVLVYEALIAPARRANQWILNAVRQKTKLPEEKVFSSIRHYGNTSSNSIPLALFELIPQLRPGKLVGLCAFGGGFTFGGALLRIR
jgi:3-oxoacyl-[acyl-carrier-protein] synthase-3